MTPWCLYHTYSRDRQHIQSLQFSLMTGQSCSNDVVVMKHPSQEITAALQSCQQTLYFLKHSSVIWTLKQVKLESTHFSFISRHQVSNSIESPWVRRRETDRSTWGHYSGLNFLKHAGKWVICWLFNCINTGRTRVILLWLSVSDSHSNISALHLTNLSQLIKVIPVVIICYII